MANNSPFDQIANNRAGGGSSGGRGGSAFDSIASARAGGRGGGGGSSAVVNLPPAKSKGGGGFVGFLRGAEHDVLTAPAHFVADKGLRAGRDLWGIPGGMIQLGTPAFHNAKALGELATGNVKGFHRELALAHHAGRNVVVGTAKGTAQTVAHPLRDPFQTALLGASVFSGGASAAGRLGEVGRVTGEGGSLVDVAKAAARKPPIAPRFLQYNDALRPLKPSHSPGMRLIQAAHDRVVQHALNVTPEQRLVPEGAGRVTRAAHAVRAGVETRLASYGTTRIGGAAEEAARATARIREVPANLLDQAASKRLIRGTVSGQRRVNEAAHELTSVNTTAENAAAYHLAQAEKGVNPELNRKVAAIYQKVADQELLTVNHKGDVIVDPVAHPQLAETDLHLMKVQKGGDEVLARYGVRTPEELRTAVNKPGQFRAGGVWVHGEPKSLAAARNEVAVRQKLYDSSVEKVAKSQEATIAREARKFAPGERKPGLQLYRPRTVDEARARYESLDTQYNKFVDSVAKELGHPEYGKRGSGLVPQSEKDFRGKSRERYKKQQAGKSGASAKKVQRLIPTITEETRQRAEQFVLNMIDNSTHPEIKRVGELIAERNRLGSQLAEHDIQQLGAMPGDEPVNFGAEPIPPRERPVVKPRKGEPSKPEDFAAIPFGGKVLTYDNRLLTPAHGVELQNRGAILSDAKTKLEQTEMRLLRAEGHDPAAVERMTAAERAALLPEPGAIPRMVGGEEARPGRGYVSYRSEAKDAPRTTASSSAGPIVPEARAPISTKTHAGYNIAHGIVPKNLTREAAAKFRQIIKFANTHDRRMEAIRFGSPLKRSSRDVLARLPGEPHADIPAAINEELGRSHMTTDTVEGIQQALDSFKQDLVPGLGDRFKADRSAHTGMSAADAAAERGLEAPNGYVWVDRNILGDLARPSRGAPIAPVRALNNVNSAVTAATVYYKVGHAATRVFTNAAANLMQGSLQPRAIGRAAELWRALDHHDQARALGAAGQHGFESMPHEGVTGHAATLGARWWATHADAPFRFNSLAYEAAKAGFKTPEQFKQLLDQLENPSAHNLTDVQRARIEDVAMRANREAIAYDRLGHYEKTLFSRAIWFYPWVKGTMSFLVNSMMEHPVKMAGLGVASQLGQQAQLRDLGLLPSYESGLVKMFGSQDNPWVSDFSTFSPFATPASVLSMPSVGRASEMANPGLGAALQLAERINPYGARTNQPGLTALSSLLATTPEAQLLSAGLGLGPRAKHPMFPPSLLGTFLRTFGSPAAPRRINLPVAHKAYGRERSGR